MDDKKVSHLSEKEMNDIVNKVEEDRKAEGRSDEDILNEVYDPSKLDQDASEELKKMTYQIAEELAKTDEPTKLPKFEIIDMTTQPCRVQKAYARALEKSKHTMNVINGLKKSLQNYKKKLNGKKPDVAFVNKFYAISKQIAELEYSMAESFKPFRIEVKNDKESSD